MNKTRQKELMKEIEKEFVYGEKKDYMFILNRYQTNIEKLCDEEFFPEVLNFAMRLSKELNDVRLRKGKNAMKLARIANVTYEQFRVKENN